ncbi:unnamed protein product [Callosobruchus maculatus]|uniref:Cytidyltransferase-like domain-containing protein n=1 Tax=Callosobruchus maculatus TaxID=64391 RepID=A0A653DCF5_CALMS|nr:unnamed protein product [Callosobruchus maculatus]
MIKSKLLWEFIEDVDVRMKNVKEFLSDICPELEYRFVTISDPFGPTVTDPTMELLVVSQETTSGGLKINEVRKEKNFPELHLVPIDLIDEPNPGPNEEKKVSSSNTRIRLLGTVMRPIKANPQIPKSPYIIGLTGGIATGKSGVAKHLTDLGAHVIYCDNIGHDVYRAGKPCYDALIGYFGKRIVGENGEVNRKILGEIVFSEKKELDKLNSIVWPHILDEVENIIKTTDKKIVVIEAAVLLKAGWEKKCHEVWTTVVPRKEVISRLVNRNGLTEEQAVARVEAQPPSTYFVEHANVVFCPYWEVEYTRQQVVKAWELLEKRIAQLNEDGI